MESLSSPDTGLVGKLTSIVQSATKQSKHSQAWQLARRFKKARPGNSIEAEIVEEYLPFVKTIAGRVAMQLPPHVDIEDIYSSGAVGLLNAVRNYDPAGGSTFESYARVRIRGAIFDELRRLDWVPRSIHDKAKKVKQVIAELEQSFGRVPTNAEVAQRLNMTLPQYEEILTEIRPASFVCLDSAPCSDEEGEMTQHESMVDQSQDPTDVFVQRKELCRMITLYLERLPQIQCQVLALYYFEDLWLREIAEVFGVTESRICQIHAEALARLRRYITELETPKVGI